MKNLFFLFLCAIYSFPACSKENQKELILDKYYLNYEAKNYPDNYELLVPVFFTSGEYQCVFDTKNPETRGNVEVIIESFDTSLNFVPVRKTFNLEPSVEAYFDFKIEKEAFYKITLNIPRNAMISTLPSIQIKTGSAR